MRPVLVPPEELVHMPRRFDLCILHIGTENTGTTTIQRFLAANRLTLAREGVLYPVAGGREGSQWGYAACAAEAPWTSDFRVHLGIHDPEGAAAYRADLQVAMEREFAAHPACHTLLISSEHFHSRLTTMEAIGRLKAFLEPHVREFAIVLYLRRQDRMAVSRFSTAIKVGHIAKQPFAYRGTGELPYFYDLERVHRNWEAVFGQSALRVRVFQKDRFVAGDLLADFSAVCGLVHSGKSIPEPANRSLDQAGIDFLREVNRQLPKALGASLNPVSAELAVLVSELCAGEARPATRAAAHEFYARFRPGNERLAARVFSGPGVTLFDEDFSEYPEVTEQPQPRYEDAVRIALRIWRHKLDPDCAVSTLTELETTAAQLRLATAEIDFLRAELTGREGDMLAANRHLRACLLRDPCHGKAHLALARQLLESGDLECGIPHLRKAREYMKASDPVLQSLSAAHLQTGDPTGPGSGNAPS